MTNKLPRSAYIGFLAPLSTECDRRLFDGAFAKLQSRMKTSSSHGVKIRAARRSPWPVRAYLPASTAMADDCFCFRLPTTPTAQRALRATVFAGGINGWRQATFVRFVHVPELRCALSGG